MSRHIQLLERAVGVKLLDRTSRLVKLTPAGRVFLLEARRILRLVESAALTTRRTASGKSGTINMGFTAVSGYSLLPRLVGQCIARLPNVSLLLKEMVTSEQSEALLTGRIDVGLLRPPIDRPEFRKFRILAEPLAAALPSGDARLQKAVLVPSDFDNQSFIMYSLEGAKYFHDMLVRLFNAHGVSPIYVQFLSQIYSILGLVQAGLGAALVPEAATSLHFEGVHFRPIRTETSHPVELYFAWHSDNDNPALEPLIDFVQHAIGISEDHVQYLES